MSAPRVKRQFAGDAAQRSITSYFGSSSSSSTTAATAAPSSNTTHAADFDFRPQPPSSVQTNLLNVGMRVRKSVPEGYKTGKEFSGIGLFTNNAKVIPRAVSTPTPAAAAATAPSQTTELQPFCGIHKVGGFASQEASGNGELGVSGLDDVPGLSLSHSSAADEDDAATSWGGRATRKRTISTDEDEEEGNRILFPQETTETAETTGHGPVAAGRSIAIPRRRKADVTMTMVPADARSKGSRGGASGDDFEDAAFLEPGVYGAMAN